MGLSFQCLTGSLIRASNRRRCSSWLTSRKYFSRMMPLCDQLALDRRCQLQEALVLIVAAEAHHPLDPRPVVPGTIEQDDLAGCGKVADVALDIELALLAVGRRRQCHVAEHAWAAALHDPLDHASLARRVAAFEHDDDPGTLRHGPGLEARQLDLELMEFLLERLPLKLGRDRRLRLVIALVLVFLRHGLSEPLARSATVERSPPRFGLPLDRRACRSQLAFATQPRQPGSFYRTGSTTGRPSPGNKPAATL